MNLENAELLQFPVDFPIKIIGKRRENFADTMAKIVLRHAPDFKAESITMRASQSGTYLSLTCTITAQSRLQLDALYQELCAHPFVQVVL